MARLLVITGDRSMRQSLGNILEGGGHIISMAEAGAVGQIFSQSGVEAILIDLNMPDAEGLPPIASLRAVFPHVPILAIAGEVGLIDFLEVRMKGADDILRQPLAPNTLLEAVERALQEPS